MALTVESEGDVVLTKDTVHTFAARARKGLLVELGRGKFLLGFSVTPDGGDAFEIRGPQTIDLLSYFAGAIPGGPTNVYEGAVMLRYKGQTAAATRTIRVLDIS